MGFTEQQKESLLQDLDKSRVASRSQSGMNLSYLEGHDVINFANKVFGFDSWNYVITNLNKVSESTNAKGNFVIAYTAIVKVSVMAGDTPVIREDVGYGSGISKQEGDAHEGATKEAVTDALKRALRGFGNGFGNALYNKAQTNVREFTAADIIHETKKFNPKEITVTNYKDAIVETMQKLGIKQESVPNCAQFLITNGLDISKDPRLVYTEKKVELEEAINTYIEAEKVI